MLELKACPRCRGDMRVNHDMYGDYKQCFQCGNTVELNSTTRRRLFLTMRLQTDQGSRDSTFAEPISGVALLDG